MIPVTLNIPTAVITRCVAVRREKIGRQNKHEIVSDFAAVYVALDGERIALAPSPIQSASAANCPLTVVNISSRRIDQPGPVEILRV